MTFLLGPAHAERFLFLIFAFSFFALSVMETNYFLGHMDAIVSVSEIFEAFLVSFLKCEKWINKHDTTLKQEKSYFKIYFGLAFYSLADVFSDKIIPLTLVGY